MFEAIENKVQSYQWLAPIFLRIGVGVVFFLFGVDKFFHVQNWIAYLPTWIMPFLPVSAELFMYIHGVIEALLGFFLIIGFWSRTAGFVCAIMLFIFTISLGYNEISIRDFGLFLGALALSLREQMKWSMDSWMKR